MQTTRQRSISLLCFESAPATISMTRDVDGGCGAEVGDVSVTAAVDRRR
jgi:hypothetical protein